MLTLRAFSGVANAGDALNVALAQRLLDADLTVVEGEAHPGPSIMIGGSTLQWADAETMVSGSGLIAGHLMAVGAPRYVASVRGPLTALRLEAQGVKIDLGWGDPGLLASVAFPCDLPLRYPLSIVPHYRDAGHPWVHQFADTGVHIIDVSRPLVEVLNDIAQSHVVASSSLHGLIIAHSYGRPTCWIQLSEQLIGGTFKFQDYFGSVTPGGETEMPLVIDARTRMDQVLARARHFEVVETQSLAYASLMAIRARISSKEY